jgi:hypothetical protein
MMWLIDEALPATAHLAPIGEGDEPAAVGMTSLVLLQVFSRFVEEFDIDPWLLIRELGELGNAGQLLSLDERLAG